MTITECWTYNLRVQRWPRVEVAVHGISTLYLAEAIIHRASSYRGSPLLVGILHVGASGWFSERFRTAGGTLYRSPWPCEV